MRFGWLQLLLLILLTVSTGCLSAGGEVAKSIEIITSFGYLPAAKKIMQWIGVDCGPARPPLVSPSDPKLEKLRAELDEVGFFEWINECETA